MSSFLDPPTASNSPRTGTLSTQLLPERVEALAGRGVVAVSAGALHSLALAADGSVWGWGEGTNYRLGHGENCAHALPVRIVK